MITAKKPRWLLAIPAGALSLAAVLSGCSSMFTKAEQYRPMVDRVTAVAKTDIPTIATALDASITKTTGTTEYAGAEGLNHFSYLVTSTLTGPTPTAAQLEDAITSAGYEIKPHDNSYTRNAIVVFGSSDPKKVSLSVGVGDRVADGTSNLTVTVQASDQLSLSDAETKRLRELYDTDPVDITIGS